jgi:membrane protein DedA with SNARE-associated domain
LDTPLTAGLAVVAAILGDSASYVVARLGFAPILGRLDGNASWHRAEWDFERWGKLAILSSRFLVTPLSLPINAIAGAVRYPFAGFFLLCAIGEVAWVSLFGGLGYLFAGSWREIRGAASDLGLWLTGAAVAALGVYEAYKLWSHRHASAKSP